MKNTLYLKYKPRLGDSICVLPVCMEKVQVIGRCVIGGKAGKLNSSKVYSIESMSDWGLTVLLHVLVSLLPRSYIVRPHQKSPYSSVALVTRGNCVVKLVRVF